MSLSTIVLPNKVQFTKEDTFKSEVVIEPLYPGYGTTLGNALRRVLLSSLPGAAVTAVKIKGIDHEFSTVPHVTEDVVDIILNLKQLRLKLDSDEPVRLQLQAKGKKEITAGDIKKDSRVEVVNPELVIATLDNKSTDISMEIVVANGRGYVPVEMRETEKLELGMIAVDAIYTPMRTVNFAVRNVRVGHITNYDKLTISMETDGTITGREALDIAGQILVDHFGILLTAKPGEEQEKEASFAETPETGGEDATAAADESDLKDLGLGNRSLNALKRNNITTKAQLVGFDREALEKLDGLGTKSVDEILKAIGK